MYRSILQNPIHSIFLLLWTAGIIFTATFLVFYALDFFSMVLGLRDSFHLKWDFVWIIASVMIGILARPTQRPPNLRRDKIVASMSAILGLLLVFNLVLSRADYRFHLFGLCLLVAIGSMGITLNKHQGEADYGWVSFHSSLCRILLD